MSDKRAPRTAGRIWTERALFAAIIAGLSLWIAIPLFFSGPCTISVDGTPVATVESRGSAKDVLKQARSAGAEGLSTRLAERVALRNADRNAEIMAVPEAARTLEDAVTVEVEAFAIVADDTPVVALTTRADAQKTLDLLKEYYKQKIHSYNEPSFKEQVFVSKDYINVEKLRLTPKEAVEYLTTASEEPEVHTIERGDRAIHLAEQYDLSLTDLENLNPQMNMEQLVEGEKLLIRRAKLPITVVCKALVNKTVTVEAPRGPGMYGRTGKRQIRAMVTYENGESMSEDIISQVTTWDKPPTSRRTRR